MVYTETKEEWRRKLEKSFPTRTRMSDAERLESRIGRLETEHKRHLRHSRSKETRKKLRIGYKKQKARMEARLKVLRQKEKKRK